MSHCRRVLLLYSLIVVTTFVYSVIHSPFTDYNSFTVIYDSSLLFDFPVVGPTYVEFGTFPYLLLLPYGPVLITITLVFYDLLRWLMVTTAYHIYIHCVVVDYVRFVVIPSTHYTRLLHSRDLISVCVTFWAFIYVDLICLHRLLT